MSPTPLHSKTHRLYASGHDLSPLFRSFEPSEQVGDSDSTTFTDRARRYQPGMVEASATGGGMLHADPAQTRDILQAALGAKGGIVVSLPADEDGQAGWALPSFMASWSLNFPDDDIVDLSVSWANEAKRGATHPRVLAAASERTAGFNSAALDQGAGTHSGTMIVQLLSIDAGETAPITAVTVKLQDRAAVIDSFEDVAGATTIALDEHGFAQIPVTGVKRYTRCVATPTGTNGTYRVSVALATHPDPEE